jgi:hypothetical protein
VLVIEVSESSLAFDREHKGSLYARALVADYWIVNLIERRVEVYRNPRLDAAAPLGWRYQSVEMFGGDGSVAPLARSGVPIRIADLLP